MHKIGILGAAGIAPLAIIEPARRRKDVAIAAVSSRRPGAAARFARDQKIEQAYDGYEAMLADPSIGLVYNALPPSQHAEWTIKALEAGKHVLCEKPFAMNGREARAMVAAGKAAGRVLMEAFHDRYHPAFLHVLALKESGALGEIKRISADFSVEIPFHPSNIRHDPAAGGGALMDLGCYPVHWVRSLMKQEPEVVAASAVKQQLGVDESITATLRFPSGTFVDLSTSMAKGRPFHAVLLVEGTRGTVEVDNIVLPHNGHAIRERIDGGYELKTVAGGTTYDFQLQAFIAAAESGTPPLTGGDDAIGNMDTIDAIYAKAGMPRV
jgi:predicted dehydrogenase